MKLIPSPVPEGVLLAAGLSKRSASNGGSEEKDVPDARAGGHDTQFAKLEARIEEAGKRSEHAIRVSERSYRRLFEAARDGILILDVESGRISDVNPFLCELLGSSHSEMIGKTVGELSPFRDIESNKIMLERLKKDRYVRYENLPLESRDGRHIAVEFVSNVYQSGGGDVIQCNIRDITDRKRADDERHDLNVELERRVAERTAQLEASNAELQTANRELEAFSYSVSHDLRAPLRHISGFVILLRKDLGASASKATLDHLTTISEAAGRMGCLIDDLLAFSRIGRTELHKVDVNLNDLVQECLNDFKEEAKERDVAWNVLPLPIVRADRALLRQVLVNLMSNAMKFTAGKEQAKIEIGSSWGNAGETVIFVRDNGVGFDPRYAGKLFGVFQRLHSQTEFEGTGIGLANVERIVQRHSGRVWAESAVDAGATFYFSIPEQNKKHE